MKRLSIGSILALWGAVLSAATLTPIQLLNPAGSTSGQAIVSTGPSTAPAWSNVTASGLTPVASNTVIANATASSASPTALSVPSCSGTNNALLWTSNTGFSCGANRALTTGNLSQFASTTSAQLLGIISDETGSGSLVFGTSPTIGTPTISGGTISNASVSATTLSATTSGSTSTLTVTDTGASGGNIRIVGNGATTPSKTIRVVSGSLGVVNDAYASQILTLTDGGNLTVTGSVTPSQTGGIVATTTNNAANAGSVGEFVCAQVTNGGSPTGCATNNSTPVSLSSNVPANVTSVSLTAGEWNCTASVAFNNGGTTTTTQSTGSISTTSATMDTLQFANYSPPATAGLNPAFPVPKRRLLLSATTTVYLVVNNVFATSTSAAYGRIECQRPR